MAAAARNVLNVDAIRAYAEAAAETAAHDHVRRWAEKSLARYITRDYDSVFCVERRRPDGAVVLRDPALGDEGEPRPYEGDVPDWCRSALDEGRPVLFVRLDGPLHKRVRRTLAHLDENPHLARPELNFTVAEGWANQARRSRRQKEREDIAAEGVPVFRHGDATVVQLTSAAALAGEGQRMWNCLAQYADVVREGGVDIYSVRNRAGASKAVMEVDRHGYVLQIKGYNNGAVPVEWRRAVRAFIRDRGYAVVNDIWNLASAAAVNAGIEIAGRDALLSAAGRAGLRALRYVGIDAASAADALQLTFALEGQQKTHSDNVRRAVFDALAPEGDAPFRERPIGHRRVYGVDIAVSAIETPLPFLNLARLGYFRPLREEQRIARRLLHAAQLGLATLAFRAPDRLHLLGPFTLAKSYLPHWASAADVLMEGHVDIRAVRGAKHRALRERLNRARRQSHGARAVPSSEHLALRWLLDGGSGQYVI